MSKRAPIYKPDWPHTHTQYHDRTGDERECKADGHHYVPVDPANEDGDWVCTRCGDAGGSDE